MRTRRHNHKRTHTHIPTVLLFSCCVSFHLPSWLSASLPSLPLPFPPLCLSRSSWWPAGCLADDFVPVLSSACGPLLNSLACTHAPRTPTGRPPASDLQLCHNNTTSSSLHLPVTAVLTPACTARHRAPWGAVHPPLGGQPHQIRGLLPAVQMEEEGCFPSWRLLLLLFSRACSRSASPTSSFVPLCLPPRHLARSRDNRTSSPSPSQ